MTFQHYHVSTHILRGYSGYESFLSQGNNLVSFQSPVSCFLSGYRGCWLDLCEDNTTLTLCYCGILSDATEQIVVKEWLLQIPKQDCQGNNLQTKDTSNTLLVEESAKCLVYIFSSIYTFIIQKDRLPK